MKKCTAFVLSGGGSRGALQVGSLRALLEAGIVPDLLVGTSIGAANATGLAMWGVDLEGLAALERVWNQVANAEMLDRRISQLILRVMIGHPSDHTRKKVENYFISLFFKIPLRRQPQAHPVGNANSLDARYSLRCIDFQGLSKTPMWNFRDYQALRQAGYEKAKQMIDEWRMCRRQIQ